MRLRTRYTQRLPVAPGLRLDVPMFEGSGTKVLDLSGKGNHGTIHNAVWTRDENGVCMTFNGTSAYIDCGNDPSLNITDAITIEAWVKKGDITDAYGRLICKSPGTYDTYVAGGAGSRTLTFRINGGAILVTTTIDNNWHHIVGTFDKTLASANIKLYKDGALVDSDDYTTAIVSHPSSDLLIGRLHAVDNRWFLGTIDEVRIYAVALTAEQIKRRYEQTKRDYVRGS